MTGSFLVARIPPDLFCTRVIILLQKHDVEFVVSTELNELFLFFTSRIQKTSLLPRLVTRCLVARLLHPCPELSELLMENNIEFLVSSSIYNLFMFVTSIGRKEPESGLINPSENFFGNPMSMSQMRQVTWTNKDIRMSVTPPDYLPSKHVDSVEKVEPNALSTLFFKEEYVERTMGSPGSQTDPLISDIPLLFLQATPEIHNDLPCPSFLSSEHVTTVEETVHDQYSSQRTTGGDFLLPQQKQCESNNMDEKSVDELNSTTTPSGDGQLPQNDELKPSTAQQGEKLKDDDSGSIDGLFVKRRAFGCQWDGCPYFCIKWSQLLNHMKTHSDEEEDRNTANQSGNRAVRQIRQPTARIGRKKASTSSTINGRNSRTLMFNQRLLAHPRRGNLDFRCDFCPFSCNREELLEQHRKMTHFRCVYCPFDCAELWDLTEHVRIEHDAQ